MYSFYLQKLKVFLFFFLLLSEQPNNSKGFNVILLSTNSASFDISEFKIKVHLHKQLTRKKRWLVHQDTAKKTVSI